jgi:uncharacterized protein YbjQ (UPF0145 family)
VADWDGQGLPPVAAERMARFERSPLRTSLLTVPGAAGVESVGFETVGEAMGCIVEHIGFTGWGGCGYYGAGFGGPAMSRLPGGFAGPLGGATVASSQGRGGFGGYRPYVDALYRGYRTALSRMVLEARQMGADGVVGVRIQVTPMDGSNREFVALGTAVRARSRTRPGRVFTTDLPGDDFAKLLGAGWVPVHIALGISVAIRHDDWTTQRQASWASGNTEVLGYTELVSHVRADARHRFSAEIRETGADGGIVSDMGLRIWQIEPAEGHRDHVAESTVFGNAVSRYHTGALAPTRSLTILPLR